MNTNTNIIHTHTHPPQIHKHLLGKPDTPYLVTWWMWTAICRWSQKLWSCFHTTDSREAQVIQIHSCKVQLMIDLQGGWSGHLCLANSSSLLVKPGVWTEIMNSKLPNPWQLQEAVISLAWGCARGVPASFGMYC